MALKDWKKLKLSKFDESGDIIYQHKDKTRLSITSDLVTKKYFFDIRDNVNFTWENIKIFKSKSEALKFAMNYMKTH